MFLLDKYGWLNLSKKNSCLLEYLDNRPPTTQDIVEDTSDWLLEFFWGKSYDIESRKIFRLHPHFIDEFIRYELFADDGVIQLVFPRGMQNDEIRKTYELITACFLFCQHYARDSIESPDDLRQYITNFFYSLCPSHESYIHIPFGAEHYSYDDISQLTSRAFELLMKTSFVFKEPSNAYIQHVYRGAGYFEDDLECIQIELKVIPYEDCKKNTYAEYMNYLITCERNDISDFRSTAAFWNNNIKLNREHDPYLMEERAVADKDLLLFCVALGFDEKVYDRLIRLRNLVFPNDYTISPLPPINDDEQRLLREFLKDAHWNLLDAKRQTADVKKIPRRLLLNANKMLLESKLCPIIELTGDEIAETEHLDISDQILKKYYTRTEDRNGNRKWVFSQKN